MRSDGLEKNNFPEMTGAIPEGLQERFWANKRRKDGPVQADRVGRQSDQTRSKIVQGGRQLFGVSAPIITRIRTGEAWKCVPWTRQECDRVVSNTRANNGWGTTIENDKERADGE